MRRLILTWRLWRCRPLHYRWLPAWRVAGHQKQLTLF